MLIKKTSVNRSLSRIINQNLEKIATFFVFVGIVVTFSFIFLRRDTELYVKIFLTQREELKYWQNYPDSYYYQDLHVGLVEKNELGKVVAQVTDIVRTNTSSSNEPSIVTVKVKANYEKNNQRYSYRGQPLLVGGYQRIRMGSLILQGYIVDLSEENQNYIEKLYRVKVSLELDHDASEEESFKGATNTRVKGILKETAESLRIGEEIRNDRGDIVAKLTELSVYPAQRKLYSETGIKLYYDQDFVEGTAELLLRTIRLDNFDYWDFLVPMQVGQRFVINFPNTQLPVRIISIVSVEDQ